MHAKFTLQKVERVSEVTEKKDPPRKKQQGKEKEKFLHRSDLLDNIHHTVQPGESKGAKKKKDRREGLMCRNSIA